MAEAATSLQAQLDARPMSALQWRVVALCWLVNMLDGFDLLAISFAAPAIAKAWQLDPKTLGIVFSSGLVGMTIGSFVLGPAADRIGRDPARLPLVNVMFNADQALRTLVAHTVDYQYANPDFVRLVMNENILKGEYLARSKVIGKLNVPAIERLREVYERGVREGLFRPGLDAVDLHMTISALSFFNVANRHSFAQIFGRDTSVPGVIAARREVIVDTLLRYVAR